MTPAARGRAGSREPIRGDVMSIVLLLLLAVAIVAVVVVMSRSHAPQGVPGHAAEASPVRKFFQYLLLLALLVIAAIGLTGLLGALFDPARELSEDPSKLARDLTFTIIGLPLFLGLGEWTRRRLRKHEFERDAWWIVYLTVASTLTLIMIFPALQELLMAAFGVLDYHGINLATVLVWGGAWAAHWWFGRRYATRTQLQPRVLIGSLIGLVLTTVGLIGVIGDSLKWLLGLQFDAPGFDPTRGVLEFTALLIVGVAIWAGHSLADGVRGNRGRLWLAYVLLPGLGGGLLTALVAASLFLHRVLVWFIGTPLTSDAKQHFQQAPTMFAAALVGLLVWWYHQRILAARSQERSEVRRVLEYLLAGVGLLAAGAGLTMVIVALFELMAGNVDRLIGTGATNSVLSAFTLLLVGLPVWWWYWRHIRRATHADQAAELESPTRRVYLLVLFGLGGIAAVGALLALVYAVFDDALAGGLTAETLRRLRYPAGILVTTAGISGYHWTVFRADRQHRPHPVAAPLTPTRRLLLIGPDDPALVTELTARTGAKVDLLPRQDAEGLTWAVDEVMDAVAATPDTDLVLLAEPDGLRVIRIGASGPTVREVAQAVGSAGPSGEQPLRQS